MKFDLLWRRDKGVIENNKAVICKKVVMFN